MHSISLQVEKHSYNAKAPDFVDSVVLSVQFATFIFNIKAQGRHVWSDGISNHNCYTAKRFTIRTVK